MSQATFKDPIVSAGPTRTGTGTGTVSIDRLTHFTTPQVYTLICIAKSPDTIFSVSGSLDGPVGLATVGIQFFDADLKIFLTLQQGATVFEVGDQFVLTVQNGTDLDQDNIDLYDELTQKNFGVGIKGQLKGDHSLRYSDTSVAAYAYLQGLKFLAATPGSGGNSLQVETQAPVPGVPSTGSLQGLTWTSVASTLASNGITVAFTTGGTAGSEAVSVASQAISVQIQDSVSTITQIRTALLAYGPAAALIIPVVGTPGVAHAPAGPATSIGGADAYGFVGSEKVTVTGNLIKLFLESGRSLVSAVTTAYAACAPAVALASVSVVGNTTDVMYSPGTALNFQGGLSRYFSFNQHELTDPSDFVEGNGSLKVQDLIAAGRASFAKPIEVLDKLSLEDPSTEAGPKIPNAQRYINRLITLGKLTVRTSDGSSISYASGAFTFSSNLLIEQRDSGVTGTISAGSNSPVSLTDGQSWYVILDPANSTTLIPIKATNVDKGVFALRVCTRIGTKLYWFNGQVYADGVSKPLGAGISDQNRTLLGGVGESASTVAYSASNGPTTSNSFISDSDSLPQASKKLDTELATHEANQSSAHGQTSAATAGKIVSRDGSGDFAAHNVTLNKLFVGTGSGGASGIDVSSVGDMEIGATVGANTIWMGASGSTVRIRGNLEVDGTTTTINSTELDVADTNITVNKGGTAGSAEGAGLTVDKSSGTKGSWIYAVAATSRFKVGDLGSEVEIMTISGAQVATNKTIAVGSNHITGTAARAAQFNSGTGDLEASAVTTTELGYVGGVTSAIQTQINGKMTNPMTTLGDTISGAASGTPARVAGNTTTVKQYYSQTGTGSASAAPVWGPIVAADLPYRAGNQALTLGDSSKAITFSSALPSTSYRVQAQLVNTVDASVQYVPLTVTAKSTAGFTVSWPAGVDSSNYSIDYQAWLDA